MKGKRTDLSRAHCGIARALHIIGDWWSLLIVREAFHGRERFGEFQKSLGLAKNILSSRLRKLVDAEIFSIEPDPTSSLTHRYVLTPRGEALYPVLVALWQWGEENCFKPDELKLTMVDKGNGKPLPKMRPTSHDGRALGPRDFRLAARHPTSGSHTAPRAQKSRARS
jgi:DNA-binding HxlR family transcriptional regulator